MARMRVEVVEADPADLPGVRWLLEYEHLPHEDLTAEMLGHFLVVRDSTGVVGAVGLELYGRCALLRSLVVAPDRRREGLGRRLTAEAEALARQRGAISLFLLTTSAQHFFESLGYRPVAREQAPPEIQSTSQFSALCPATAVLMSKP